jgi:hypothetical protein
MVGLDINVGFEAEPTGLEEYLTNERYTLDQKFDGYTTYLRENDPPNERDIWPEVIYVPGKKRDGIPEVITEHPWNNSRFKIISEVIINFDSHSSFDMYEEADRLADEITRKFNGVRYSYDSEEIYTKEDLGN